MKIKMFFKRATALTMTVMLIASSMSVIALAQDVVVCDHVWDEGVQTVAATCKEAGEIKYTCTLCEETKTEETAKLTTHSAVTVPEVEATCTQTGLTAGKYCSVCGEVLVEQSVIPVKEHNYGEGTVATAPTCTKAGSMLYVCQDCGYEKTEEIAVTEHNFDYENAVETLAPTCTEKGKKTYTCLDCGATETVEIPENGHTLVPDAAVEATCSATGLTEGEHCSVCGEVTVEQETVEKKPHTEAVTPGVAATCTTPGMSEEITCSVCGEVIKAAALIKPMGHSFTEQKIDLDHQATEATCSKVATYYFDCANCDEMGSYAFEYGEKNSSNHVHTEVIAKLDPTCTSSGYEEYTYCFDCKTSLDKNELAALGHKFVLSQVVAPTCTEEGYEVYVCQNDPTHTYTDNPTPALGHTPVVDERIEPTCYSVGYEEGSHCSVCNEVIVEQKQIPMLDHDYSGEYKANEDADTHSYKCVNGCGEYGNEEVCSDKDENCVCDICKDSIAHKEVIDPRVEPDCLNSGLEEGKHCSVCGEVIVEQQVIDALGHDFTEWSVTKAPTCTETGDKVRMCKRGGCNETEKGIVEATGHTETIIPGQPASCTTMGIEDAKYCEVCNTYYEGGGRINPLGHSPVTDEAVVATCLSTGLTEGSHCSRENCGVILTAQQVTPVLEHSYTGEIKAEENDMHSYKCVNGCNEFGGITECIDNDENCICDDCQDAIAHVVVVVPEIPAECEKDGESEWEYCSVCGETLKAMKVLEKTGHKYVVDEAVSATCTQSGLTTGIHCEWCGLVVSAQQVIPATGHVNKSVIKGTEPTCTTAGKTAGIICADCETVLTPQEDIAALGHNEDGVLDAVEATCTTAGKTEGKFCTRCDTVMIPQQDIAALDHIYTDIEYIAPTCTEEGKKAGTYCERCDKVLSGGEVIEALGHSYSENWTIDREETCTQTGEKSHHCSNGCGDRIDITVIPAAGHKEEALLAVEPTCTETGLEEGVKCSVCDEILVEQTVVPALGHSLAEESWVTEIPATCTSIGQRSNVCSVCQVTVYEDIEILPHNEVIDERIEPTCISYGYEQGSHCGDCGLTLTAQAQIPMLNHSYTGEIRVNGDDTHSFKCINGCEEFSDTEACSDENADCICDKCNDAVAHTEVIDEAKAPTCIQTGLTQGSHCSVCGAVIVAQEVIPVIEHSYTGEVQACENDTHKLRCVNGCDEFGEATACVDEDNNCICDICEDEIAHSYDENAWETVVEADCLTVGSRRNFCTVCGYEYTEDVIVSHSYTGEIKINDNDTHAYKCVNGCEEYGEAIACTDSDSNCICDECEDAIAHTEVIDEAKDATCEEDGLTEGKHCSVCGEILVAQETVTKLGHRYEGNCISKGDGTHEYECLNGCGTLGNAGECTDSDSTCTCDVCGFAMEHSFDTDWIVIMVPTCLAEGSKINECTVCGQVITESAAMLEHSYTGEVKTEDGDKHSFMCVNGCEAYGGATECIDENSDCICDICKDAVAHTEVIDEAKEATCTQEGLTEGKHCSVCGEILLAQEKTEKKAHVSDNGTVTTAPTCTKTGVETYKCTVCGETVGTKEVPVIAHKEVTIPAVSATYTKTGLTAGKKCSVCGKVTLAQKTTEKLTLGKVEDLRASKVKVDKASEITLKWDKVSGAEKYEVYIRNGSKWTRLTTTSKSSYTVKKDGKKKSLKPDEEYKFRVRAVVDSVKGKYSSSLTVETIPETTSKLTLKAGKKQLTASWSSVSGISGYEVQYSTSKKMKNAKKVSVKKSSKKTTIKKLTKGKKYYVRLRTYKTVNGKKIYSDWSAVKNVKVK